MGPIGCPETSVRNYHYSLRNNPDERIFQLLLGGLLKSRIKDSKLYETAYKIREMHAKYWSHGGAVKC